MKLFHFTSWIGIHGIANSGFVKKGKVHAVRGRVDLAVSLTTNSSHRYLGLPDGRNVEPEIVQTLPQTSLVVRGADGGVCCLDHVQFRLEFDIPDGFSGLVKLSDFYADHPEALEKLAVTAMHPFFEKLNLNQQFYLLQQFHKNRNDVDRTDEWWYFLCDLPLDFLVSVAPRAGYDEYSASVPKKEFLVAFREVRDERKTCNEIANGPE